MNFAYDILVFMCLLGLYTCTQRCSPEIDVDYRGVPTDNDLIYEYAPNFQACCAICDTISLCRAWTWVYETKVCILKNNIGYKMVTLGSKLLRHTEMRHSLFILFLQIFFRV
jgi:hypothetical protein